MDPSVYRIRSTCSRATAGGRQHRWQEALAAAVHLQQVGVEPDAFYFLKAWNAAAAACARSGLWAGVLVLLHKMLVADLGGGRCPNWPAPDVVTFNVAMNSLNAISVKPSGAHSGFSDNSNINNNNIINGPLFIVEMLLHQMRGRELSPDLTTYNTMLAAEAKATTCATEKGRWPRIFTLLEDLRRAGLVPDAVTCTAAAGGCSRTCWAAPLQWLQLLRRSGARADAMACNAVI
ncbi:unnamed protein product, partial [Polarella glacialis]